MSIFSRIKDCYESLTDDISKKAFILRLQYSLDPSLKNAAKFLSVADPNYKSRTDIIKKIISSRKKIYFYGAGYYGIEFYNKFRLLNANIDGIFDKAYTKYGTLYESLCDLLTTDIAINLSDKIQESMEMNYSVPILQPATNKWVKLHENENYIICVTTKYYFDEIKNNLIVSGVSENNIINLYQVLNIENGIQYFDFMQYYNGDGAFIDAGCFNGNTSVEFASLSGGNYTNIYAFEPDLANIELCNKNFDFINLRNVKLQPFGLGSEIKTVKFLSGNGLGSRICDQGDKIINITTIDDSIKDEKVSFIKMDIEGAELDALKGAVKTIKRDKPFCAISIYHKPEDILTIIGYLKTIVPDYKFKIRHYTMCMSDTILYAYI